MKPRIEELKEKKLVGKRLKMSLTNNRTGELWKSFMPCRQDISNSLSSDLISMQVYDPSYYANFNHHSEFEKWASVEVTDFNSIPKGMEPFTLPGGLYAVFDYQGSSSDPRIFQYIFTSWLPYSKFQLDHRPHFEVLGAKYINNDPNSEEEIWIPVKEK